MNLKGKGEFYRGLLKYILSIRALEEYEENKRDCSQADVLQIATDERQVLQSAKAGNIRYFIDLERKVLASLTRQAQQAEVSPSLHAE